MHVLSKPGRHEASRKWRASGIIGNAKARKSEPKSEKRIELDPEKKPGPAKRHSYDVK
jgi:hypothetical protein